MIQPKKQGNKKSRGKRLDKISRRSGAGGKRGVFIKKRRVMNLCQLCFLLYVFQCFASGICVSLPRVQIVFDDPGPQSVFARPQPSICIYRPCLIRLGNNKSQRLYIMLLFLLLLSNSFVTVIGCCLLLLFLSQVVVRYQFHYHK